MTLEPYLIISGFTADMLQKRCQTTLQYEEEDDGYVFYYMPWGAPFVTPDETGQSTWYQAFIVSSHPVSADDDDDTFSLPYRQSGSGLN